MLTVEEALIALAETTANATVEALFPLSSGQAELGPVSVAMQGRDPLDGVDAPAMVASVSYLEGGGAVLTLTAGVARRLLEVEDAEADFVPDQADALATMLHPVMQAAAAASGKALGHDLTIEDMDVRIARQPRDLKMGPQGATRSTLAVVSIFGEACRLIGLVPSDFVRRISQPDDAGPADAAVREALGSTLRDVPLRVWAEVGRARLRSAEVASLGDGAIVELDRSADDPVDLYVNGSRIATGRLVCIDGKEWALRLEEVFHSAEADPAAA